LRRTEISVLISGESGVGKEVFPQIIHQLSARKHGPYIAVNCGAIPEGTMTRNCSVMKKVRSRERMKHGRDTLKFQTAEQSFWMKSVICH